MCSESQGVEQAGVFADLIRGSSLLELVVQPSLALVVFRIKADDSAQGSNINDVSKAFFKKILARSDLYLTQTELNGVHCVRFSAGGIMTEERHVRAAFKAIEEEASSTLLEFKS